MRKQRGFTIVEALTTLIFMSCIGLTGLALCVPYHFIHKFW